MPGRGTLVAIETRGLYVHNHTGTMHREIRSPARTWAGLRLKYVVSLLLLAGCAEDVLTPTKELATSGPPVPSGVPIAIVAGLFGAGPVRLGGKPEPVSVRVVDSRGIGVPGVRVFWRVLAGGGTVRPDQPQTGADGIATAGWGLGLQVNQAQVVEVTAPNLPPFRPYAQGTLSDSLVIRTDLVAVTDTVRAILPDCASVVAAPRRSSGDRCDGDPVRRVLVPLPGAPFITPVFPERGFGSVYVYGGSPRSFGVYMYADLAGSGTAERSVCAAAWTRAPFTPPTVSAAELADCGPTDP